MKEQILSLRQQGKSYDAIALILNCSKSNVAYYCSPQAKKLNLSRRNRNRKKSLISLKLESGGKCQRCGYDKCLDALHFHHLESDKKDGIVSRIFCDFGLAAAREEALKCQLVCANCHAELHEI